MRIISTHVRNSSIMVPLLRRPIIMTMMYTVPNVYCMYSGGGLNCSQNSGTIANISGSSMSLHVPVSLVTLSVILLFENPSVCALKTRLRPCNSSHYCVLWHVIFQSLMAIFTELDIIVIVSVVLWKSYRHLKGELY